MRATRGAQNERRIYNKSNADYNVQQLARVVGTKNVTTTQKESTMPEQTKIDYAPLTVAQLEHELRLLKEDLENAKGRGEQIENDIRQTEKELAKR